MSVSVRLRNCNHIIRCIETLEQFSSECWMRFSSTGWYIQVVNPYGASCCDLNVKPSRFDDFTLSTDQTVINYYISLSNLLGHLLKHKDDNIVLEMNSLPNEQLEFTIIHGGGRSKQQQSDGRVQSSLLRGACGELTLDVQKNQSRRNTKKRRQSTPHHASNAAAAAACGGGGSSSSKSKGSSSSKSRNRGPKPIVGAAGGEGRHAFVLPSKTSSTYRENYVDLTNPIHVGSSLVETKMDANNLNNIFRDSSVLDQKIYLLVHPETRQMLFYTQGEKGELLERFTGIEQMRSRSDVQLTIAPAAAAAKPHPAIVSEQYSNRFIKFFSKIMHPPLIAQASFSPSKPLIMSIDLNPNVRICAHISPWSDTQPMFTPQR